jgi:hypothetical protein
MSTGYTSTSKGVQQFDITVERDSKLEVISSTNNTLQVVNLVNKGSYNYLGAYERDSNKGTRSGDLTVLGDTNNNTVFEAYGLTATKAVGPYAGDDVTTGTAPDLRTDQDIDGAGPQQNNGYGFTDVRVLNGGSFTGNLKINAILTQNVTAKYLNLTDQANAFAAADNVNFNYTLGSGNDVLDLAISAANLSAAGTTTREDFVLNINAGNGNDVISTAIVDDYSAPANSLDPLLQAAATTDSTPWYSNSKLNANLNINAGTGNDTINTLGSGDWKVTLGTGNDTYYADNTANKAVWVFNTADQVDNAATAQRLNNLLSDENESRSIYHANDTTITGSGLRLRVVFKDVSESANAPDNDGASGNSDGSGVFISHIVDVPLISQGSRNFDDLAINQAIKKAINEDPVLSKLLLATDGPANTLVVTALSDGAHLETDLQIDFAGLITANNGTATTGALGTALDALLAHTGGTKSTSDYDAYGANAGDANWTGWFTSNTASAIAGEIDYKAKFANTDADVDIIGSFSTHTSDNIIYVAGGSGDHDVVVLSTGGLSNDTLKWEGFNNGIVTVVNFDAENPAGTEVADNTGVATTHHLGQDWLDFSAYGAQAFYVGVRSTADNLVATNGWLAVDPAKDGVPGATLGTLNGTVLDVAGEKYITLTRVAVDATNADESTLYRIDLWTLTDASAPDAYASATTTNDVPQLIGFVDLGRALDDVGLAANDNILAQIVY